LIQLSSLLPIVPHGPVRPALLASGASGSFALALGRLVVPRAGTAATEGEGDALVAGRQALAEAGKDLPAVDVGGDETAEEQEAPDGADIAFAWFATSSAPQPTPAAPGLAPATRAIGIMAETGTPVALVDLPAVTRPTSEADAEVAVSSSPVTPEGEAEAAPVHLPTPDVAGQAAPEVPSMPAGNAPDSIAPDAPPSARSMPDAENATPAAAVARPAAPSSVEQPVRQAEALVMIDGAVQRRETLPMQMHAVPAQAIAAPAVAAPAPLPLHPAILNLVASVSVAPAPLRRTLAIEPAATAMPPVPDGAQPQVSAAADVQQVALDTRRQEWMGKMVEHIEALRDAAPVRETRLSLAPEVLGKVEVSIRREGDRLHVHFTTETHAARQLIADAQPRLGELAEARGLKLGQTSFESGTAGQGGSRDSREQPTPPQSLKPRPANPESAVGAADDDRIA
jgi:flagellar hook-length control protein FliK